MSKNTTCKRPNKKPVQGLSKESSAMVQSYLTDNRWSYSGNCQNISVPLTPHPTILSPLELARAHTTQNLISRALLLNDLRQFE